MERKEIKELLNERVSKHSQLDLLHIMENKAMEEEYSFLMQHRTAVALEDIVVELKEISETLRELKEDGKIKE